MCLVASWQQRLCAGAMAIAASPIEFMPNNNIHLQLSAGISAISRYCIHGCILKMQLMKLLESTTSPVSV